MTPESDVKPAVTTAPVQPIEPIVWLLFGGMIIAGAVVIACEVFWRDDGSLFTLFSGVLTGFMSSFFTRLRPASAAPDQKPTADTTKVVS